jgi:SAM-dependent methyltransferase
MSSLPRLYDELADLWALLSPPDDYEAETSELRAVLRRHLRPCQPGGRHSVLELGSGGGHSLVHLTQEFEAVGVDLSARMLQRSQRLNPGVHHVCADMCNVRLSRRFDAVLIHDAIDYLLTEAQLRQALATAAAHLDVGGMLVVAPTYVADTFTEHAVASDVNADGDIEVAYVSYVHDPDPGDTSFELIMTILVRRDGKLSIEQDCHVCGLFPMASWLRLLDEAGFDVVDQFEVDWQGGAACRLAAIKR